MRGWRPRIWSFFLILVVSAWSPYAAAQQRELVVTAGDAPILLAPVLDAPLAILAVTDQRLVLDAEVWGEPLEGSRRWYFVVYGSNPAVRGFVHESRVAKVEDAQQ